MAFLQRLADDTGHRTWALVIRGHAIALRQLVQHPWASLVQIAGWLRTEGGAD